MSLDLSAVATSLLNELGSNGFVKLVRLSGSYDAVTGIKSQTESVLDLAAIDLPVPTDLIDGTLVRLTDKLIIMDNAIKPVESDLIRIEGNDFRVVSIQESNHAGIAQTYRVIARG